jgi:hypothetical protein
MFKDLHPVQTDKPSSLLEIREATRNGWKEQQLVDTYGNEYLSRKTMVIQSVPGAF